MKIQQTQAREELISNMCVLEKLYQFHNHFVLGFMFFKFFYIFSSGSFLLLLLLVCLFEFVLFFL